MVKNPSCSTGDPGSIPGPGTKIPYVTAQLSLHATTRESVTCRERSQMMQQRSHVLQLRPDAAK